MSDLTWRLIGLGLIVFFTLVMGGSIHAEQYYLLPIQASMILFILVMLHKH